MALPAEFNLVTLTGRFVDLLGQPLAGKRLTLSIPPEALHVPAAKTIVTPEIRTITLDANGSFSEQVPATNDPDVNPTGFTYTVSEQFGRNRSYSIAVPLGGPWDLTDLAPVPSAPGVGVIVPVTWDTLEGRPSVSVNPDPNSLVQRYANGWIQVNGIFGLDNPNNADDVANKGYVDNRTVKHFLQATQPSAPGGAPHADIAFAKGFTTVPLTDVIYDTATGWNAGVYTWAVPVTGVYDINATFRVPDGTPAGLQVGIGVGTNNTDSPTFVWMATTGALRTTFQYTRNGWFPAGSQVRLFVYVDSNNPVGYNAASLSMSYLGGLS